MHGLSPGLLLLAIMLSVADPTVRLAFLAGVPGEVLLRLLRDLEAGEEGAAKPAPKLAGQTDGCTAATCTFRLWQSGQGALGLQDKLQGAAGSWSRMGTRQALLQVLLWCFFEVVPLQQQQQQQQEQHEEGKEAEAQQAAAASSSSSSSASSGRHSARHVQQMAAAARTGVVMEPLGGELLRLQGCGLAS
jgi:hypothetical protein